MAEALGAQHPQRGWRFWIFVGFMLALMVLFVVLGTWQVERLGEKERLIADVAARADAAPISLPPVGEWAAADFEPFDFRPVTLTGHYLPSKSVLVFTALTEPRGKAGGPGDWVLSPFALEGGGVVFVNRGFVPQEQAPAFVEGSDLPQGDVTLTGVARLAEAVGPFTPSPDAGRRTDWVRNPERLKRLATVDAMVAPVYVDLPAGPPGALPQGGETVMEFPNNHLGYAMTWYGFAVLVPPLLWLWVRRQRRPA
jgi:surfeit locus 1 family protein